MKEQLYKKQNGEYTKIFPLNYIQNLIDSESGNTLTSILQTFNNIYIPYQDNPQDTRNIIPESLRRKGLWITYNNGEEYITEYYKGDANNIQEYWTEDYNWEVIPNLKYVQDNASKLPDGIITPEKLSPALQELIKQNNIITNLPDDEDLEEINSTLKLKDRKYNSELASGKGYKILRKNWTKVGGKMINLLTQDMINETNTVYEIRYDFDLNEKEITIPLNCVLQFNGGSFSNGIINLNKAYIQGEGLKCKFINPYNNIIYTSSLQMGNDIEYDTKMMEYICSIGCDIIVNTKTINLNKSINVTSNISIIGKIGDTNSYDSVPYINFPNSGGFYFSTTQNSNKGIKNLKIQALDDVLYYSDVYMYFWENLKLLSFQGNCICTDNSFHARFNRVSVSAPENGKAGFKGFRGNTTVWTNCTSDGCFAVFMQCRGLIESYNGTWGTSQHFIYDDETVNGYGLVTVIKNSNIESFQDIPIVLRGNSDILILDKTSIYNYQTDGRYTHDTIYIDFLAALELYNNTTLYEVGDGYYPIRCKNNSFSSLKVNGYNGYIYSDIVGLIHCVYDKISGKTDTSSDIYYFEKRNIYSDKLITKDIRIKETEVDVLDEGTTLKFTNFIGCYALKASNDNGDTKQVSINYNPYDISANVSGVTIFIINKSELSSINIGLYGNSFTIAPKEYCSYYLPPTTISTAAIPVSWNGYGRHIPTNLKPDNLTSFNGGLNLYDNTIKIPLYWNGNSWCLYNGININGVTALSGNSSVRRGMSLNSNNSGFVFYDTELKKEILWNGTKWVDFNGNDADISNTGTFEQKPSSPSVGFAYFCTDRQTTEGSTNGIMIYHKGNNVWVDALGRVVS